MVEMETAVVRKPERIAKELSRIRARLSYTLPPEIIEKKLASIKDTVGNGAAPKEKMDAAAGLRKLARDRNISVGQVENIVFKYATMGLANATLLFALSELKDTKSLGYLKRCVVNTKGEFGVFAAEALATRAIVSEDNNNLLQTAALLKKLAKHPDKEVRENAKFAFDYAKEKIAGAFPDGNKSGTFGTAALLREQKATALKNRPLGVEGIMP